MQPDLFHTPFFQSYVQTYIERDVRLVEDIRNLTEFERFIRISAALSAQELDSTKIAQEVGVTAQTIKRWQGLLESTYLWHQLPPYHGNTLKRLVKRSKGHFSDCGLASNLIRINSSEALGSYPHLGALFESFVISQVKTIFDSLFYSASLYHWRTSNGSEVDLIIECDNCLYPIEIKAKSHLQKNDTRGIKNFFESYPNSTIPIGIIVYPGDRCYFVDEKIIAIPCHGLFG